MSNVITCPFCGFETDAEYTILLHMETQHAEGKSPFVADQDQDSTEDTEAGVDPDVSSDGEQFAECPVEGCEEIITLAELDDHVEFHAAEEPDAPTASTSYWRNNEAQNPDPYVSPYMHSGNVPSSSSSPRSNHERDAQHSAIEKWKKLLNKPSPTKKHHAPPLAPTDGAPTKKRLGKAELGKYAHENKMPDWLVSMLKKGRYVSAEGIIPVLQQLLEQNPSTRHAYLCHPAVQHISKLRREGGFCGYRNIQMLSSYIVGASAPGAELFHGRIPSIFRIQDYIENAWDMGINTQARIETGGVRGTRKYIGTPEAQAMLLGLGIPCDAQGFKAHDVSDAERMLLTSVERYFESGRYNRHDKVRCTSLPPIYFQHRGHSLTIIGLEKHVDGTTELLVFDPMFHDPAGITRLVGRRFEHKAAGGALKLYRRGNKYLKKYNEFETLRLKT